MTEAPSSPPGSSRPPGAHTLVVGGTGMLRHLCLALAARGHAVSVIAQRRERLAGLVEDARALGGVVNPLPVDYTHGQELDLRLGEAISRLGPISLAVCWIHDDAPRALPTIAQRLRGRTPPARVFHLLGSATIDPTLKKFPAELAELYPDLAWRRITLGFKTEGKKPRWLTHEEIWTGTLAAIDHDWTESVIGLVRPWSGRPKA